MPYISRTYEEIFTELQSWTKLAESQIEATFEYDVFSTNAIEFAKTESELAEIYRASFGDTAWGEYLEMRAAEHGVIRRGATKSKGEVIVKGNGTVKEGFLFSTSAGARFAAIETKKIDGSDTVLVEAVKAGAAFNVAANTINKIPIGVAGIYSVNNPAPTIDGYDAESDVDLRNRYLLKVRRPATSGNPREYVEWATSIAGVGAATCIRNWRGRGTVKVVIVDSNLEPANEVLISRVAEYIETERPIGAEVTVVSAIPVIVDIKADVVGNVNMAALKKSIGEYFRDLILNYEPDYTTVASYEDAENIIAGYITRSKIGKLILNAGADDYDYDSIRLDGKFEDIALSAVSMPLLGTIKLTIS